MSRTIIDLSNIHSLTAFQRSAKEHLKRLKKSRQPLVLTVNGKAELVVQDAASYQKLLEEVDRAEAVEGIKRGLASMEAGKGRSLDEFDRAMRRKHKALRAR